MSNIVVSRPYKAAHVAEVYPSELNLAVLQLLVDGHIQVVHPDGFPKNVVLICNEEGKRRGLDFNRFIMIGGKRDVICGTCIICATSVVDSEPALMPLSKEQAQNMLDMLNG